MKKILIVDDDKSFLQCLSSIVRKQFQMYEATGVNDALKVLETVAVDAICSDFNMRDGTGLELLKRLRLEGVHIPFLLMSGFDDTDIINETHSFGASFCCKTDYDLIAKIKALVNPEL